MSGLERGVPPALREDFDAARRAKVALGVAWGIAALCVPAAGVMFVASTPELRWVGAGNTLLTAALACATGALLRRGGLTWAGNWLAGLLFAGTVFGVVRGGGVLSPFVLFFPLAVGIAAMIAGRVSGLAWTAASVGVVVLSYLMIDEEALLAGMASLGALTLVAAFSAVVTLLVHSLLVVLSEQSKRQAIDQIGAATRKLAARAKELHEKSAALELLSSIATAANAVHGAADMIHMCLGPMCQATGFQVGLAVLGEEAGMHYIREAKDPEALGDFLAVLERSRWIRGLKPARGGGVGRRRRRRGAGVGRRSRRGRAAGARDPDLGRR